MNAESNMYNPWKSVEFSTDFHGECFSYVYVLVHVVWITIEVLLSLENGCTRTFCSSRMVGIPPVIPHCIVVRKISLRVQYKQILLLAPSRWLRTTLD